MNLIPYFVLWGILAIAVLGLALYRKLITFHGDGALIHLAAGEENQIPQQVALSNRLLFVDRWGKILTIATALFGLLIVTVFLFEAWQASFQIK
jgi:hypothetical protein